jgi:hypothetical protein
MRCSSSNHTSPSAWLPNHITLLPPTHTVHARGPCGKLSRKHTSISRRCQPNEFYWDLNLSHQIHYAAALLRTAIDRTRACAPEQ